MAVSSEIMDVTPQLAAQWLGMNHSNRKIKTSQVTKYVRDMLSRNWFFVGDPIRLEKPDIIGDEALLDGQNRLTAVVESGTTQKFIVVRGLDREAQTVMDSGSGRTVADTLTMEGYGFGTRLAALSRAIYRIDSGPESYSTATARATNAEIIEAIKADLNIVVAVEAVEKIWLRVRIRPVSAAVGYYYGLKQEPEMTAEFFKKLRSGTLMDQGDPVLALSQRLNIDANLSANQQLFAVLRAMNLYRRGNKAVRISLPRGIHVGGQEICYEVKQLTKPTFVHGAVPGGAAEEDLEAGL